MSITLVTGGTGFLGRELVAELVRRGVKVRSPIREGAGAMALPKQVEAPIVGDLTEVQDFEPLLAGVDTVMHLAARAHVTNDRGAENSDLYRVNNEVLTQRLAVEAQAAGVRRFVFASSIKAFGETDRGQPFRADDLPEPCDAYGRSKLNAERALQEVCAGGGMQPVIVRPPLVYGPGVRANFLRMMRLLDREVPLPLAGVRNRRSMVSRANLVDFLCRCREEPDAANQILLVSDGEDLSTPELLRRLAAAMRKRARLFKVPEPILRALARAVGYGSEMSRLTDSLSVNIEASCLRLRWTPPVSIAVGLSSTVDGYLRSVRS